MNLHRALLLTFAVGLLTTNAVLAQRWRELGPAPITSSNSVFNGATGRVAAIATSGQRNNLYYIAGASGGVWMTADAGATWTALGDDLPTLSIGAIAVDPTDDRIIYAGSGEANTAYHSLYGLGLFKSTDSGANWQVLGAGRFAGRAFSRIAVSPADRNLLLVAIGRAGGSFGRIEGARNHPSREGATGIWRSTNGGIDWTRPSGLPGTEASDVVFDPQDPRRIFAAFGGAFGRTGNGIYRSDDGGATWRRIGFPVGGQQMGRTMMAIAPSNPRRIYALVPSAGTRATTGGFSPGNSGVQGLYRSNDGGASWTRTDPGGFMRGQGNYDIAVAVDPTDPDVVFLGGVQMLRSVDGGATFANITPPHVDLHHIVFDRAGRLLVAADGGVYSSTTRGNSWRARNNGLAIVQYYAGMALSSADQTTILVGSQDNGTHLRTAAGRWLQVFGGDGGYTHIDPQNPAIRLVEFQGAANLFRSVDGGIVWNQVAGLDANDRTAFQAPLAVDPSNSQRLLYASHRIYESTNGGTSWQAITGDLTRGTPWAIRSLAIAPADPTIVHAVTNNGRLLTSRDRGFTWSVGREGIGGWPRITRQIAFDPGNAATAYVADMRFGGTKVLETRDSGASWQSIAGDLPNVPVNTVAVHRSGSGVFILAGTDAGVFVSGNRGRAWTRYGTALPRLPVQDLLIDLTFNRLVATTLGRGVWTTSLPTSGGGGGDGGDGGDGCTETLGNGRFCTACGPCAEGEGDCDNDTECQSGLSCTDNIGAQFGFAPGVDVCTASGGGGGGCTETLGNGRFCTACGPCGEGEGDCDNDTECQPGLICTDNVGAQFGFAPGVDVCTASGGGGGGCTETLGNGRFCTACGPCGEGEGDCDNDSECQTGLSCVDNIGAQFGFAPGVDVCTASGGGGGGCTETLGNGRFCTACGPCAAGQGDCDNDSECQAGLTCVDNIGAQFGFAPGVDVCQ